MFEIKRYTPEQADEWNQFVAASKNGTFLFDRRYMDYHADRFEDHSLMFYDDGLLMAVLPAHKSGDTLCSHNGLTYGGLVMSPRLTVVQTLQLFRELNDCLRGDGFHHVSYKCIPWIYHRLSAEEDLYALYHECRARIVARDFATNVFLSGNMRWERVRRRGVARAQKAGVSIECSDDYSAFWEVLTQNLQTKYDSIRLLKTERSLAGWCCILPLRWSMPSIVQPRPRARSWVPSTCSTTVFSATSGTILTSTSDGLRNIQTAVDSTSSWFSRKKVLAGGDCVTTFTSMTYDCLSAPEQDQCPLRR